MLIILIGSGGVLDSNHNFMKLFAGTDTDFRHLAVRKHCLCQIRHLEGRNLADKGFSAGSLLQSLNHQLHPFGQANPEAGHPVVGDGKLAAAVFDNIMEKRNNGTPAARHVAVTDDGKIDILGSGVSVGCNEKLVGNQLGSPVKIDRINRFVRGKSHHLFYIGIKSRVNHVLGPVDVGLYRLVGIVLTGRHLL